MGSLPRQPKGSLLTRRDPEEQRTKLVVEQELRRDRLLQRAAAAGFHLQRLKTMFRTADVKGGFEGKKQGRQSQISQRVKRATTLLAAQGKQHRLLHEELEPHRPFMCSLTTMPEETDGVVQVAPCHGEHPVLLAHVQLMRALGYYQLGLQGNRIVDLRVTHYSELGRRGEDSWPLVVGRLYPVFLVTDAMSCYRDIGFLRELFRPNATLPISPKKLPASAAAAKQAHHLLSATPRRRRKTHAEPSPS